VGPQQDREGEAPPAVLLQQGASVEKHRHRQEGKHAPGEVPREVVGHKGPMEQPAGDVAGREDDDHREPDPNASSSPHLLRPRTEPAADGVEQRAAAADAGDDEHGEVGCGDLRERQRDAEESSWVDHHDADRREEVRAEVQPGLGESFLDSRIGTRREDSNRFDPGLLRRIARYDVMFRRGLSRIVLPDVSLPRPALFDTAVIQAAHALSDATPSPRRVRVSGRLDLMGVSQGIIKIHVADGAVVTALWDGEQPIDDLRSFLNRDVVCEGLGVFRPSGSLLRIDADAVAAARPGDTGFAVVPRAPKVGDVRRQLLLKSSETSAYRGLLGSIAPEESDEDFAAAIEAMS